MPCRLALAALIASCALLATAHKHHDHLDEEEASKPVDALLWMHIVFQVLAWGIIAPIGMVFGITRSRFHVPFQVTAYVLSIAGYFLGHMHKGRAFLPSVHGKFANILFIPGLTQLVLGIYLKLHINEGTKLRTYCVRAHGVLGKSFPILGWTQMLFGALTFRGYCRGDNLGQCLAHYIMGSGFIAYASIMTIIFLVGETWVRRSGKSPEWFDSWVILLWGIVNTFTEHRGSTWSVKDLQHTMMGVLWWAGGILGVLLSRNNQRTVVPSLIIIFTGWGMAGHHQALEISTQVHAFFGYLLITAGAARIIEVCFIVPHYAPLEQPTPPSLGDTASDHTLADSATANSGESPKPAGMAFRHLPPFLLVSAGLLFMSATDEELRFAHDGGMDHVTYVLIMLSLAFTLYAFMVFLLHLYSTTGRNAPAPHPHAPELENIEMTPSGQPKWYSHVPTTPRETQSSQQERQHVLGGDDEDD